MAEDWATISEGLVEKLRAIKKRAAAMSLDYLTYQGLNKEILMLEQEGMKRCREIVQAAQLRQTYGLASQVGEFIGKWQKEVEEVRKYLKRKSPSA